MVMDMKQPRSYINCIILLVGTYFFSSIAFAAEEALTEKKSLTSVEPASMGNLLEVTLGLITVLVLIFVVAWIVKRYGSFNSTVGGNLRIVGGLSLGQKERVMLVQVGEKQILLGVSPGKVEMLCQLDEPLAVEEPESDTKIKKENFSDRLQAALSQRLKQ